MESASTTDSASVSPAIAGDQVGRSKPLGLTASTGGKSFAGPPQCHRALPLQAAVVAITAAAQAGGACLRRRDQQAGALAIQRQQRADGKEHDAGDHRHMIPGDREHVAEAGDEHGVVDGLGDGVATPGQKRGCDRAPAPSSVVRIRASIASRSPCMNAA